MKISPKVIKNQVQVNRFHIPYRVYGNGGPHVVCLNGVQQSMAMWQSFVNQFAKDYRILLFDFPGQGKAQVDMGPVNASIDEQVEILHEVIKASNVHDITICSASWGGVVALAFVSKYPHLTKRLLLGGMGTKPSKTMIEIIKKGCSMDENNREEMAKMLIESFGVNLPEEMKARISRQFCAMSKENLRNFSEHGSFVLSKNLEEIVDFNNIKVDTVLISGENDKLIDIDDVKFLATQIPNCRLKIVKNVGHFLHLEDESVLNIYGEFIKN
ncbi:MAG: alpha/beta hydrolase [Candidatus Omnitrophica bacterium]|nr:alpha/beta hydrolase [Candidatus Omnitrophota bacterium]